MLLSRKTSKFKTPILPSSFSLPRLTKVKKLSIRNFRLLTLLALALILPLKMWLSIASILTFLIYIGVREYRAIANYVSLDNNFYQELINDLEEDWS
jgi:hypothetical protein